MLLKGNEVHPVGVEPDRNGGQTLEENHKTASRKDDGDKNGSSVVDPAKDERRGSEETGQDILSIPLSNSGFQRFLPKFLRYKFADKTLEDLYMAYFGHQRRKMLQTTLVLSMFIDMAFLIQYGFDYSDAMDVPIAIMSSFLFINICLSGIIYFSVLPSALLRPLPYVLWGSLAVQIYADIGFHTAPYSASLSVGWQILYMFSSYVWLPMGLSWCIIFNTISPCIFTLIVGILSATDEFSIFKIGNQIAANCFLFLCVNVLGSITYLFADRKLRRDFLETKSSLSIKVVIEEEYKQQERLLLSVLPKHVADEMVKDIGLAIAGQFRKIYMSRHENVSILFADIVGFTAISSTCTAQALVGILNELFATFDKLAKLYCQLRIKILGDCYYCICGAPEPRSDHAVLSIHMGLAVVEAISDVREKTKTNVNMRVGIHTGAVLGGVLGQKQWQFDVLGKEVSLANHMESGGIPGRVHISEQTKSFLKDEFELEPGEGDQRDDFLRMTGTTTYLIKTVKVPFPGGTLEKKPSRKKARENLPNGSRSVNTSIVEETDVTDATKQIESQHDLVLKQRLYEALMENETKREMWKVMNVISLHFKNASREMGYIQKKEHFSGIGMVGLCLVPLACFAAQLCIGPKIPATFATFAVGEILLIAMTVVTLAINYPQTYPRRIVRFSNWIESRWLARSVWGTLAVVIMASLDVLDMFTCDATQSYNVTTVLVLEPNDPTCQYPSYFIYFGEVSLIGVTLLVQISHILKSCLIVLITCTYVLISLVALPRLFDRHQEVVSNIRASQVEIKYTLAGVMCVITLILLEVNRALELISRRLHYCKEQAEEQKEEVTTLRQKNEALVYNILPSHVAKDFIGRTMRDEELYSSLHEEVAVMFASCPNFNDFYSEDAINNNGLECLRFLNEIISDYDEMLKEPRFKSITKIKTVQSTYMAASGMMAVPKPGATVRDKWQHLDDLVQFAFCLKDTLDKINAQSFNTFVLRIGINHGPIVAGVIGARKPHYDIWGNTVNVASRMESTGQAGRTQIVEESMLILKEFGYTFEKRGLVSVKGKGQLLTFFVNNRDKLQSLPNQVAGH